MSWCPESEFQGTQIQRQGSRANEGVAAADTQGEHGGESETSAISAAVSAAVDIRSLPAPAIPYKSAAGVTYIHG